MIPPSANDGTIFEPDEEAVAGRIRLSSATPVHLEAMSLWLPGALAPDWRIEDVTPWVEAGAAVLICDAASVPIGVAVVVMDAPVKGAASVPLIAVEPERRYRGLGGEAGIALERHLRTRFGIEAVYAPIPDGRGLAVYFWLRLGYRPLTTSEAPWPLVGITEESKAGMWMVREGE